LIIDLHTHSKESDGTFSPEELIFYAKKKGLRSVAITDHDTVSGLLKAKPVAFKEGIELVPGVEISADYKSGELHILGYYFDPVCEYLISGLDMLKKAREKRNPKMVEKLNDMGMKITFDDVAKYAGGKIIGRPHIARALIEAGYASSFEDAFARLIGKGKPAYVKKDRMSPYDAVSVIKKSGGVAFVAHPVSLELDTDEYKSAFSEFKDAGFDGIEVFHTKHSKQETEFFKSLAEEFEFLISGGSDFHTPGDNAIDVGCNKLPYEYLEKIKNYIKKQKIRG
jgi:predicted metal-dependent phosphoesterase TrpH